MKSKILITCFLFCLSIISVGQTSSSSEKEYLKLYTVKLLKKTIKKNGVSSSYFYMWFRNQKYSAIVDSRSFIIEEKAEMNQLLDDLKEAYKKMKIRGDESFSYDREKYSITTSYKYITIWVKNSAGVLGYTNIGDNWMTKELSKTITAIEQAIQEF